MKIETKINIATALAFVVFMVAPCASAVTADWEAVKRLVGDATNDTLQAAKDYSDQHGCGSGGGGVPGNYAVVSNKAMSAVQPSGLAPYCTIEAARQMTNGIPKVTKATVTSWGFLDAASFVSYTGEMGMTIGGIQTSISDLENGKADRDDVDQAIIGIYSEMSGKASSEDLQPLASDIRAAYNYSRTVSLYMTGNTNAWFAGTNYVFGADAATRTKFAWEAGMDAATVPCSMALWEIRDGAKQCVWDQRDWTAWYWSFKSAQMRSEVNASNAVLRAEVNAAINSDEAHAWAKRYAATGRVNPDASTTFIDTPSVTLSPGMSWETVATVGGCGYWTIVGNGAVIGGSGTNAVLDIKDFEGNSILQIAKGEHRLAWLSSADFVSQMTDANGWVCFDMRADVQPTGYFSTTLVSADFVAGSDANCPAQFTWENRGGGVWRVHFLLKPGIVSDACFAKFQVEVEGKTQIRYNADTVINGGLIYNGVKIAPVIPSGAAVGSTVTWKVVQ